MEAVEPEDLQRSDTTGEDNSRLLDVGERKPKEGRRRGLRHRTWSDDEELADSDDDDKAGPRTFSVWTDPLPVKSCLKRSDSPASLSSRSLLVDSETESGSTRSLSPAPVKRQVRLVEPEAKASLTALREFWATPAVLGHGGTGGIAGYRRTRDVYTKGQGGTGVLVPQPARDASSADDERSLRPRPPKGSRSSSSSPSFASRSISPSVGRTSAKSPLGSTPSAVSSRSSSLLGHGSTARRRRGQPSSSYERAPVSQTIVVKEREEVDEEDDDGFEDCDSGSSTPISSSPALQLSPLPPISPIVPVASSTSPSASSPSENTSKNQSALSSFSCSSPSPKMSRSSSFQSTLASVHHHSTSFASSAIDKSLSVQQVPSPIISV